MLKDFKTVDYVLYGMIFIVLIFARKMEASDIYCPKFNCSAELCRDGNGTPYSGTEVEPGDTNVELTKKIMIAANVHRKTVYWRRTLIITILTQILIWLVLFNRPPSGKELVISSAISGGIWYFSFNYYNFHHFDYAKERIKELLKEMNKNQQIVIV